MFDCREEAEHRKVGGEEAVNNHANKQRTARRGPDVGAVMSSGLCGMAEKIKGN